MTSLRVWLLAARPKTLLASVAPVMVGTAMAFGDGRVHWPTAFLALVGALLIQIGTNFCNDYADFKKGADTTARVGPLRATQSGLISPAEMQRATFLAFGAAAIVSIYFILRGGWPYAVVAVTALLSGWAYTSGPFPLGYHGLGDLFVLVFFGPIAVAFTYHAQASQWSPDSMLAGLAVGLLAVAVLVSNNLRDEDTDRAAGKHTLVVRFGTNFGRLEYSLCIVGAIILAVAIAWCRPERAGVFLAGLTMVPAWSLLRAVWRDRAGELLPVLPRTARLLMLYAALFSVGWLL